jgi:hypothetical protein
MSSLAMAVLKPLGGIPGKYLAALSDHPGTPTPNNKAPDRSGALFSIGDGVAQFSRPLAWARVV